LIDSEIDLLEESVVADPYPLYAELRQDQPVSPLKGGGYLLTRHADVVAALANPNFQNSPSRFSVLHSSKMDCYESSKLANNILPFQDAPVHTENRKQVLGAYNPCARKLAEQLPQIADDILVNINNNGDFDIVADFGTPYSIAAMARFFGLDRGEASELAVGANAFFHLFTPISDADSFAAIEESLTSLRTVFRGIVERQKTEQPESFTQRFSDTNNIDLIADNSILLFADGIENIQFAVGTIWSMIAERDDLMNRIADDKGALKKIAKELVRLHTPAQSVPRIAGCDIQLHDKLIKRGIPVHLSIGSANRDEAVFSNPDKVIIDGGANRERAISFGAGKHSCIGGNLAIEMLVAAMQAFKKRQIVPLLASADLAYIPRFAHRWPECVMARANK